MAAEVAAARRSSAQAGLSEAEAAGAGETVAEAVAAAVAQAG